MYIIYKFNESSSKIFLFSLSFFGLRFSQYKFAKLAILPSLFPSLLHNKNIIQSQTIQSMDDSFRNPFTQSRVSIATTSSLLTYGDNNLSFFNRLQTNNRMQRSMSFASHQEVEERILGKFERQMYTMDESGHCLAQTALDQMITQDEQKKQDFWGKIKSSQIKKEIRNPFATKDVGTTKQTIVQATMKKLKLGTVKSLVEQTKTVKTKRHSARSQMIKLKDIIKKQKQKEEKGLPKPQKFSLVNLYKTKRQSFQPISTILTFANPNLQTRVQLQPTIPSEIKVKGIQYFLIPLSD